MLAHSAVQKFIAMIPPYQLKSGRTVIYMHDVR